MKNITKNAKKVFGGAIYDVYQWEQEMFDGSIATFEKLKRPDTATVIAVVGDKIILQEQEQPAKGFFLSLPGGRADKDEKTIDTAKRELLEETGYSSRDIMFWKTMHYSSTISWNDDYFIARDCKHVREENLDNGEKIKNKLISFDEFVMLSENESFRHRGLSAEILRMRLHPEKLEEFRKLLFNEK